MKTSIMFHKKNNNIVHGITANVTSTLPVIDNNYDDDDENYIS